MIADRIYNRSIQLVDRGVIFVYDLLEQIGVVKPISYKVEKPQNDIIRVEHSYPKNIAEKDKPLFEEWRSYPTFENKLFVLSNCNVSYKGTVFKGSRCFVPALPHPVFKAQYGPLFCWKQNLFFKKTTLDANTTYYLVTDHWAYANYFHWMVDSMCRLIEWREELKDLTLLLHEGAPRYITDALKYLGIEKIEWIKKDHYVAVPNLVVPNYCAWSGQQHPVILRKVKEFILDKVEGPKGPERIYVSRGHQKVRKIANEQAVIEVLQKNDFAVVHFEGMSVAGQISIVKHAKIFVSSHGANMTNALFTLNCRVFELLRNDRPNFCYWGALSGLSIEYRYQLCKVVNHDDLLVDIEQFKIHLQKVIND
jgi:hypothetical protein